VHRQCAVPKYLRFASADGAESIILSVGGPESIILSASSAESMMLSACDESMIVSVLPAKSMILSVLFDCVTYSTNTQTVVRRGATKKTTISNTDNCQLTTWVNSASTAPPIGLPPKGAESCHTSNRLLVWGFDAAVPYRRCNSIPCGQLVVCWWVGWSVGWSVGRLVHHKGS
jgi:hypothetical protein